MYSSTVPNVQELTVRQPGTLPERYIRFQKERPSLLPSQSSAIPVIDMQRLLEEEEEGTKTEITKLATACQEWGFFQLVNHGIPPSLTERVKGVSRDFLSLPLAEKQKYRQEAWNEKDPRNTIQGYGQAFVFSEDQPLDWADMLLLKTLPEENRNMRFWPTNPADFKDIINKYTLETQKLAGKLLSVLAEHLGLRPHDYFLRNFGQWVQSMRISYYPPCPRPDLALGMSAHSDGTAITTLLQDDRTVGLQIRRDEDAQWISVPPIPNALVINIGDILEVMSNGKYRSIEHRVVTNKDSDRISVALFHYPADPHVKIGPAPELIDDLHPCLYKTFLRSEYERTFFCNKLDGKKSLDSFKLKPSEYN